MAAIEQQLAAQLIDARAQEATTAGGGYVPAAQYIAALARHLEREQWWRERLHEMTL